MSRQLALLGPNPPKDVVTHARRVLDVAIRRYEPVAVFGMFSGGHDSLCATHMASQRPEFTAAVHINTGIGIPETRQFVRETAEAQGWPLLEYRAADEGQVYGDMVLEHGFPGPAYHRKMYNRLKERPLRALTRDHKSERSDRIMLVTGVRRQESQRRMGTAETINRDGARVWAAPLIEWSALQKGRYMARHGLPRNPVVDLLHMSGECLCGAFAKPGELEEIEAWFPETAATIRDLERCAREAGAPNHKWGRRPPSDSEQDPAQISAPLCASCERAPYLPGESR